MWLIGVGLAALVGLVAVYQFIPDEEAKAISAAQRFVALATEQNREDAFDATAKNDSTGRDLKAFNENVDRQGVGCGLRFAYVFPKRTFLQRFRQTLDGTVSDQINVEFDGCRLVRVSMRRDSDGTWKVWSFRSHAG